LPLLILAEGLIFLSNYFLKVSSFMMILSAATMFFMTFGIVSLGIGMGAIYPRFRFENAAQIASGFGGFFYMIVSLIFIGGVVILEAWPVYTLFMAGFRHRTLAFWQWTGIVLSFAGVAVLMGIAIILPMRVGLKAITERDF
jgi:ABC-2 type transport system permease protein